MSTSTEALLVYGIPIDDKMECELDKKLAAIGIDLGDAAIDRIVQLHLCEMVMHGHLACETQWILAVQEPRYEVECGLVKDVDPLRMADDLRARDAQLEKAAEKIGLTKHEAPGWHLVACRG